MMALQRGPGSAGRIFLRASFMKVNICVCPLHNEIEILITKLDLSLVKFVHLNNIEGLYFLKTEVNEKN